ncbi:MAG: DNA internalization-related competence protein ComEC/Rec2 [Anaerolineaceae bacterium]|nr:MAG: DNA internalization-related competence protein ComEC/Rec2 [Anaerolineaceae bacterium]
MTIIYWTASWLVGIWFASLLEISWFFWLVPGTLGILGAVLLRQKPAPRMMFICLSMASLGAIRFGQSTFPKDDDHISNYNGFESVTLTGLVAQEPDVRDQSTDLFVETESLSVIDGEEQPVHGPILVRSARFPAIEYGSHLRITGRLEVPANKSDFDYRQYLARRNIFTVMDRPNIVVLETGLGNPITRFLLAIKARAQETIDHLLPEPQGALLSGILLGNDRGLPADLAEDFRTTGMTHIIAISGFNIAIVAGILLRGSRHFVARRAAAFIALLGITLYTILVGVEASVVRAAIMGALFIVAVQFLGRPTFHPAALFTAALFMTLANPHILWDMGFQLSFAAVLGLMLYVGPWSKRIGERLQPQLGPDGSKRVTRMIADILLATLAATVMTLPVLLYHFETFPLISPLANTLILPAQPGVMIFGGLATILGMILPALGQLPAWVAWLLLTYTINLVRFFASLPYANLPVSISFGGVIAIYGLVITVTWLSGLEKQNRLDLFGRSRQSRIMRALIAAAAVLASLIIIRAWNQPDDKLHVTFLDVGQGDAIFIQSPDGHQILVDGGRYPSVLLDQLGREMPFWDKDIDIMVATHPDEDHISGLVETLGHYQVGMLVTNGEKQDVSPYYDALLQAAESSQVPIHVASTGEVFEIGNGVRLEILHPDSQLGLAERNDYSISMRLVYEDFTLLLTGDAEDKAERMMLQSGRPLQSLVFKAGHHGSGSSSSRAFLQAVKPKIVIISVGAGNRYEHPHPAMLQRAQEIGATVLRTDELGTIELISDGHEVWWESSAD